MHDNKEEDSKWSLINTVGASPGMRYGHTLAFLKPFFIMFGGNTNSNDIWIIDINAVQVAWTKLDFPNGTGPCPRLYHTVGFCSKGSAQGMMIVFGGRDLTDNPLNDIWGFRRHRDGRWDCAKELCEKYMGKFPVISTNAESGQGFGDILI